MKLSIKLPFTFAAGLVFMLAAALYGIYSLNQSLNNYGTEVQSNNDCERAVVQMLVAFKAQVQEWKDTLLRGKDPQKLEKHWAAFAKQEGDVNAKARALLAMLPEGESKALVDQFAVAHARMGEGYRKGFEAFKAAGFNPAVGDAAVAGVDREPARLLAESGQMIAAKSAAVSHQAAADGKRATIISLALMLITCVLGIVAGVLLSKNILKQLGGEPQAAAELASRVAQGDLSVQLDVKQGDTTSMMARLAQMRTSLAEVVSRVRQNSESVASASAQIAQGNQDLSQRTEEQAAALEETAASMEEFSATVKLNADNARQANQLALSASAVAVKGGEVVGQVVETMKGINEASKKIADIITVIDSISFQTNILALNAAVEAARAGEQGRGFAVVASEVRNLAGRSAQAAKEIKGLISASVERVALGTTLVDQAGATMTEVVGSIKRVTDIVGEISAASNEQSAGVSQVGEAVSQMDRTTQQNASLVEESAAAAESLKQQAHQLVQAVAVFKLAHHNPPTVVMPVPVATAAPSRNVTERRGPNRATNVTRPRFGSKAESRPDMPALSPEIALAKTGTDHDWTSF